MNRDLYVSRLPEYHNRVRWVLSRHHVWMFGLELDGVVVEPDPNIGSLYTRPMRQFQYHTSEDPTIGTVLRVFMTPYEDLPALLAEYGTSVLAKLLLQKGWAVS